jgi:hypothetical protein
VDSEFLASFMVIKPGNSCTKNCSDPVFWQCFSRYPKTSKDVLFVDVDYKDLMLRKREMVKSTNELNEMLTAITMPETGRILLKSDQYVQIGCDLRELHNLEGTLASILDLDKSLILFVAEVSITYMDVKTSDALIKWCGSLPHGILHTSQCLRKMLIVNNSSLLPFGTAFAGRSWSSICQDYDGTF